MHGGYLGEGGGVGGCLSGGVISLGIALFTVNSAHLNYSEI